MPDKWEYPWFAAWDLAFHTVALAAVDIAFAKQQLELLLDHRYLHPNGQLPAYEWNFSDVNPPVHAWATWFVYELEKAKTGKGDRAFLERSFRQAHAELRLVAEPQGRGRPQHLPGRVPRPGQHRRVRPQRAAAGRRPDRPGRRDRLDGAVQPEHVPDRDRAGAREPGLRRAGAGAARELGLDRRRDQPRRPGGGGAVGRGRRLLLRRAATAGRQFHPAEGALARRADAAGRRDRHQRRRPRRISRAGAQRRRIPGPSPSADRRTARPRRAAERDRPGRVRPVQRGTAAPDPGPDAR